MARGHRQIPTAPPAEDTELEGILAANTAAVDEAIMSYFIAPDGSPRIRSERAQEWCEAALALASVTDCPEEHLQAVLDGADRIITAERDGLGDATRTHATGMTGMFSGARAASLDFYADLVRQLRDPLTRTPLSERRPERHRFMHSRNLPRQLDGLFTRRVEAGDLRGARRVQQACALWQQQFAPAAPNPVVLSEQDLVMIGRYARARASIPEHMFHRLPLELALDGRPAAEVITDIADHGGMEIPFWESAGPWRNGGTQHVRASNIHELARAVRMRVREGGHTIVANSHALQDLYGAHAESPALLAPQVAVIQGRRKARDLEFVQPLQLDTPDGPHVVDIVMPLRSSSAQTEARLLASARTAISDQRLSVPRDDLAVTYHERERTPTAPDAPTTTSVDALFGRERCLHQRADWRDAGDAVRLHCPECMRPAVVTIPRHQLPERHDLQVPDSGGKRHAYALRARGRAILRGEDDPHTTWDDLRAEGATPSLNPVDYALRPEIPAARRRPTSFGATLSA